MVGRIYTDTSVIGGCEDEEFRVHSRRLMDAFVRGDLRLVLSELTLRELAPAPQAVREVLAYTGHRAEIRFLLDKPVGPMNRVADNALAKKLLGWEPQIRFVDGLRQTIDWYFASKDRTAVGADLERKLTER